MSHALLSRGGSRFALLLAAVVVLGACSDATTAPRGAATQIAYTSVIGGVGITSIMNADGTNAHLLTASLYDDLAPVISPDGRFIAVTSDVTGFPQVYVMAIDGSGRIPVTNVPGGALLASWSPDGKRLLFNSAGDARTYMVNVDGTGLKLITRDTLDEQLPVLSPDGQKIVFVSVRNSTATSTLAELYVMNADGTSPVRLTTTSGVTNGMSEFPAWSPDGKRIAFIRVLDDAPRHVWIVNADGTGLHQLFTGTSVEQSVAWSPDGTQLAFARKTSTDEKFDIYVSNADGSNVQNITNSISIDEVFPSWGRKP